MVKPLENVRVLDSTQALAGPVCTRIFASFGAEVIRIEAPWGGYGARVVRGYPPDVPRRLWGSSQANKKSITLNLRSEKGKEIFLKLVKKSDVVVENFSPGVMKKMGLGYDIMKEANPKIIYCAISGYGQSGPWKDRLAYDPCVQAASGLMSITGYPGCPPVKAGASISDCLAGIYAAVGTLIALHARNTITGEGQMIDCAMFDSSVSVLYEWAALGKQSRMGNRHPYSVPSGVYRTRDGKLEFMCTQTDEQWETLMKLLGREDIVSKKFALAQRVELGDEIDDIIQAWVKTKTQQEIEEILNEKQVPCSPVMEIEEVKEHPHTVVREMFVEVDDMYGKISGILGVVPKLSETPGSIERGTMPSGSFNEEIYAGLLGYSEEELEKLKGEGVI